MPWDSDLQKNNQIYNNPYSPSWYEKANIRKLLLILGCVILAIIIVVALLPESQQSKYVKSATAAARKRIPDAKVSIVKVAGDYATAIVRDPSAQGQANSGNLTIFKVNKDGSMTLIADGSYFSTLDLLGLGIPLATQAKLTGKDISNVRQSLETQCGYSDGVIGYVGFDGSFNPGGWQIDSASLNSLEEKLSSAINNLNENMNPDMKVVCVNATRENSNDTIDKTTYISTLTLQVQFVSNNGTLTKHTVTFSIGPKYYRSYYLDGNNI